jgi:hypothetical protein
MVLHGLRSVPNNHVISALAVRAATFMRGTYYFGDGGYFYQQIMVKLDHTSLISAEIMSLVTNDNYVFAGTNGYGV